MEEDLVIIDYNDLLHGCKENGVPSYNPKLHPLLHKAFGNADISIPTSSSKASTTTTSTCNPTTTTPALGLIVIQNIPNFIQTKRNFLPLAHKLISLPKSYLDTNLTDETSLYNAGWSHGKEKLKNDQPDLSKGSFYFNPLTDTPGSEDDRRLYPASYPVNKWPDCNDIPDFEVSAKELGLMMKDVVTLLAYHIDEYVKCYCEGYNISLGKEMMHTEKVKGRLLYYFPHEQDENKNNDDDDDAECDSWIGWHNDSGFLTALAGDIYVDHDTGEVIPKHEIDPKAGLYIQDRNGSVKQILIPDDCMAIQIGECLQIVTGGHVVATPHCVRGADPNWSMPCTKTAPTTIGSGSKKRRVARISFPCFVDTIPSFPLNVPPTRSVDDVLKSSVTGCAKVPPLEKRWDEDGMAFGDFLQKTFALYYEWTKSN